MTNTKLRLGDALIESHIISNEQLKIALDKQKTSGKRLGQILLEERFITQQQLVRVLKAQFGVESLDLRSIKIDPSIVKLLPENLARRYNAVPVKIVNSKLIVAMSDPLDRPALVEISMFTKKQTEPVISSADDIKYVIYTVFSQEDASKAVDAYVKVQSDGLDNMDDPNLDINSTPIVQLATSLIETGVRMGASDIHIEPDNKKMRVRMRVDGILQEILVTSNKPHNALVSRIKIMADLNIAEKRLPQDGRILTEVGGKEIDLRIAIMPSTHGEKVVIRILDRSTLVVGVNNLGLDGDNATKFTQLTKIPYGMIFVTGPTGSGKTTTLYTVLMSLNDKSKNIVTLEDPVEFDIEGVTQTPINPKAGLTFATGLRAFMRSDPDIIMVGEVRDEETADVAVNSALTGHLVLSTLHTNDSVGAVLRLIEMGVKPYILASSLSGVVAQRLVRKICPHCKKSYEASEEEKLILNKPVNEQLVLYRGTGCEVCNNTGYKGRTGVFEVLNIDKEIRQLIVNNASSDEIKDEAIKMGMTTLQDDTKQKILIGITTIDEFVRVIR